MPVRQRLQIAAARPRRVHPKHAGGDFVIGTAMRDSGFDGDDGEIFQGDALAVPLTKIERRRFHTGNEYGKSSVFDDSAAPHVEDIAAHAGEMTVFVFEFKASIVQRDEFDFEFQRTCIQTTAFAAELDGASASFEFSDGLRIADANSSIGNAMANKCTQQSRAVSGCTATNILGRFHEHGQARRQGLELFKHFIRRWVGDLAQVAELMRTPSKRFQLLRSIRRRAGDDENCTS